ncbi:MAG: DUF6891 domain-containing protein [Nocardioidaceae bacterium]
MAIGSPNRTARLEQLRVYARCQVWSGYREPSAVRAEVLEAVQDEVTEAAEAERLTDTYLADARQELVDAAATWPVPTGYERLQAALEDLRAADVIVLEAVEDHWEVNDTLDRLRADGHSPRGVAYFTHTDIWHAIENDMLELNVWHGNAANVIDGDELLTLVCHTLERHQLPAAFDEGRIEVTIQWQRRLSSPRLSPG